MHNTLQQDNKDKTRQDKTTTNVTAFYSRLTHNTDVKQFPFLDLPLVRKGPLLRKYVMPVDAAQGGQVHRASTGGVRPGTHGAVRHPADLHLWNTPVAT